MALTKVKVEGRFVDLDYKENVEDVLEQNKILRTQEQTNTDGLMHVATIPNAILLQWYNEEQMKGNDIRYMSEEFTQLIDRKLKDPDWAHLLVTGPRPKVGWKPGEWSGDWGDLT